MIKSLAYSEKEYEEFEASFKGECSCGEKVTCHTGSDITPRRDKKRYWYTNTIIDLGECICKCRGCRKEISTTFKPYF